MINVIMSAEPVDLTPKFNQLKADLLADIASKHTAVISNTDNENAAISAKLDSLTTVNGQISTEVQAINTNTNIKIAEAKTAITSDVTTVLTAKIAAKRTIKSIQRGVSTGDVLVSISAVDPSKTVVNLLSNVVATNSERALAYVTLGLLNSTQLEVKGRVFIGSWYTPAIRWEVIEYE